MTPSPTPSVLPGETMKAELDERVLPDDYPIYADYLYVADGEVVRSDWHGITAREFKAHLRAGELRRCDIAGRQALRQASDKAREMGE